MPGSCATGQSNGGDSVLIYAGGSYEVPKSSSDTGGSKTPQEDDARLCFTKYKSVAGTYGAYMYCTNTGSCVEGTPNYHPGCTEITYSEVGPSSVSEGRCVDP